ncbi:hypothetical protein QWY85_17210 [Neolewinella lacunae]|uniref:Uncharacterized protein n=1 Tax=Neolewinella lacunae TaxID=1517758 RepID=A0A923PNX9_9BACT|nr:hypothetical protein [Neolewinella lacunae]MBC6995900.1 hypothetical protein [Neolewinella lacunae]MDN3636408.1 hypothetical protein [Neolewinella lacunae]
MKHPLIIVEDSHEFTLGVLDTISTRAKNFEVIERIPNPGSLDDFAQGKLVRSLRERIKANSNVLITILLDINFGAGVKQEYLGIDVAKYLLDPNNGLSGNISLVIMTTYEGSNVFSPLYDAGVKVFIPKRDFSNHVQLALDAAVNGNNYFGGINTATFKSEYLSPVLGGAVMGIAKGFSNKAMLDLGYASIAVQKSKFREARIDGLSGIKTTSGRSPSEDDWNDVWYLLHFLAEGNLEIIRYVEELCGLSIQKKD